MLQLLLKPTILATLCLCKLFSHLFVCLFVCLSLSHIFFHCGTFMSYHRGQWSAVQMGIVVRWPAATPTASRGAALITNL